MKCRLVKLEQLSGNEATVYSVLVENEQKTLFQRFVEKHINSFRSEIKEISDRLWVMGNDEGARYDNFKHREGAYGDFCCALYDKPKKKLRLYCLRYGTQIVILAGGGPKNVRAWQEDPELKKQMEWLKEFAKELNQRIDDREITYTKDFLEFVGDLEFDI